MMLADAMKKEEVITPRVIPEEEIISFILRCSRLLDELFGTFRKARSYISIQDRLIRACDLDPSVVAGQLSLAASCRGNADYILHHAILAPRMWLDLLTATGGDIYVG